MISIVFGTRGSGKSSWIKQEIPKIPRVLVYDTLGEYTRHCEKVYDNADEMISYLLSLKDGQFFQVCYFPPDTDDIEDFNKFCRIALAMMNITVIVDEVDMFCSPHSIPRPLSKLARYGRHYNLNLIIASRRPPEISRQLTALAERFIVFAIHEVADVKFIKSIAGVKDLEPNKLKFVESKKTIKADYYIIHKAKISRHTLTIKKTR